MPEEKLWAGLKDQPRADTAVIGYVLNGHDPVMIVHDAFGDG